MKMFINRKHTATYTLSLIASLALAFTSCVQLGEEQEGAYGYLTISGFDVDVQVEQLVPTKGEGTVDISSEVSDYVAPTLSSVTVTSASDQEKSYTWKYGDANLKLPAGTYSLSATSGSNGFGEPYYVGTGTVTVVAGQEVTGKVEFTLGNSVMKVTNGMPEHFTVTDGTTVTISSGDKSVQTTMTENVTGYVFVPSEENLTVNVVGKNSLNEEKEYNTTLNQKTAVGKAHDVIISKDGNNWPTIELGDLNAGAFEKGLYFLPAEVSSHLVGQTVTYQIKESGASEWENITPTSVSDGKYLFIGELSNNKKYSLRASVGAFSSEKTFTPKAFADCITITSVDPRHSYTNNELDGTDVKAKIKAELPSIIAELARLETVCTFKNASLESRRSFTSVLSNENGENTIESGKSDANWPYIPKGSNHTLEVSTTCTLPNDTLTTESSMSSIEVPAPEFTPTVSLGNTSYTSYDKYAGPNAGNGINKLINGNKDQDTIGANDCQPETLYSPSVVIGGIHENLLKNPNYKKSIEFYLDAGTENAKTNRYSNPEMSNNTYTGGDFTSLSWGSHTLTASFTFDGISATFNGSAKTHHITGLPYSISFEDNIQPTGWTLSNNGSSYSRLVLKWGNAYAITPAFGIVNTIDVKCNLSAYAYRGSVGSYKPTVSIHASEIGVNSTVNKTLDGTSNLPYSTNYESITSDITLTDSVEKVCIYTSGKGSDWSVGSGDMGVVCQNFSIIYR